MAFTSPAGPYRAIFLFLDGVGMGTEDPAANPLVAACLPTLNGLLAGSRPTAATGRLSTADAELIPIDARLGVAGRPQSATGQATILSGVNVARAVGGHYGPRPNQPIRDILDRHSLFARLNHSGLPAYFCNAYPQRFFDAVRRGKRLLSAVPYAASVGGQELPDYAALADGRALSADFTGASWRDELGYLDAPVYTSRAAGRQLWQLAQPYRFVFFEHWLTDVLGHRCDLRAAVEDLQTFDGFLAGLLEAADLEHTLVIVGSDHGNVEDCRQRSHTENPALGLLLGAGRTHLANRIACLDDLAPAIVDFLTNAP
jgi:2,3-bisphosphoglycerate-independent phosphoglycerate mutase